MAVKLEVEKALSMVVMRAVRMVVGMVVWSVQLSVASMAE
jgi:hypothetical protein